MAERSAQASDHRRARSQLTADPMLLEGGRHTGGVVDVSSGGRSGIDERHRHMVSPDGAALHPAVIRRSPGRVTRRRDDQHGTGSHVGKALRDAPDEQPGDLAVAPRARP